MRSYGAPLPPPDVSDALDRAGDSVRAWVQGLGDLDLGLILRDYTGLDNRSTLIRETARYEQRRRRKQRLSTSG